MLSLKTWKTLKILNELVAILNNKHYVFLLFAPIVSISTLYSIEEYGLDRMYTVWNTRMVRNISKIVRLFFCIFSNTLDRMVEDMILESMSKGHFENLSGFGKPHKFSDKDKNPYVDKITAKLNQILIEDDMKPEWITMQKAIR